MFEHGWLVLVDFCALNLYLTVLLNIGCEVIGDRCPDASPGILA